MVTQVEEFRAASRQLVSFAQDDIRDVLSAVNSSSDPKRVRDLLLAVLPDFMTAYGDTAAVLGADYYDMMRRVPPSAGGIQAVFGQPAKKKQTEQAVRWAVGSLFLDEPSWDGFESNLLGAAQRLVMLPARETVDLLARADARSGKVAAVRWARRTDPARAKSGKSCDFCIMLEGRGPVYRSEGAAKAVLGRGSDRTGFDADGSRLSGGIGGGVKARGGQAVASAFHDNCHCVQVPTFYQREMQDVIVRGYRQRHAVLTPI